MILNNCIQCGAQPEIIIETFARVTRRGHTSTYERFRFRCTGCKTETPTAAGEESAVILWNFENPSTRVTHSISPDTKRRYGCVYCTHYMPPHQCVYAICPYRREFDGFETFEDWYVAHYGEDYTFVHKLCAKPGNRERYEKKGTTP